MTEWQSKLSRLLIFSKVLSGLILARKAKGHSRGTLTKLPALPNISEKGTDISQTQLNTECPTSKLG